jgi:DNA-directed RNA polymerase subunit F
MFNRLPSYTKTQISEEFGFDHINEVGSWEPEDREELRMRLRSELDSVMTDIITDLDNEALEKLHYILKKHWQIEYYGVTQMDDLDCILVHNYLKGIHFLE